jgi:hypothetical protein
VCVCVYPKGHTNQTIRLQIGFPFEFLPHGSPPQLPQPILHKLKVAEVEAELPLSNHQLFQIPAG